MRMHSDVIGYTQTLRNALQAEREAGRIAPHVTFKTVQPHRSSSHQFAFEVQLEAAERDNGRRAGNSGSYGAMRPESDGFAATFDEWGWLMAALYAIDPHMVWGSVKNPTYSSAADFDHKTGLTYAPADLLPMLEAGHWPAFVGHPDYTGGDPYPYCQGYTSDRIGRRGFGRIDITTGQAAEQRGWPVKLRPRSPESYRAFAHLEEVSA